MAIREYQNENGETRCRVTVTIRSKENRAIRVQRSKFNCMSEKKAQRKEVKLTRECQAKVSKEELKSSSWRVVVNEWEKYLKRECFSRLIETTRLDYVSAVRNYTEAWMDRPAASITRLQVKEALTQLRVRGGSQGFQKRMKGLMNQVFVFGIESSLIKRLDRSPTIGVQLDRPEEKKPEILTTGEIRRLLSDAKRLKHPCYPVWAMALLTGMRSGELYALLWSDISWENRAISVNKSYNGRLGCIKSTKSGYWRAIPISNELMALLRELQAEAGNHPSVLHHNHLWTRGYQADELRKLCIGIGVPSIRFHALRACFATQLI